MRISGTEPSSLILSQTKLKPKGMVQYTLNITISINFNTEKPLQINWRQP